MAKTETAGVEATRARILDTAAALFREKGYDGTSMNELARRVGITAPGLYWHFSSKEDILVEYLETSMLDLLHITGSAVAASSPRDKLRAFVVSHVRYQVEKLDRAKVYGVVAYGHDQLKRSLGDQQQQRLRGLERRHLGNLERILEEGIADGTFDVPDVHSVAFAILAMGEHAVFWFRPGGRLSATELAELYGDLALRIVEPPRT
jgi:TetR/AcrR family transcriptional regulator, cholesterol catabolism regulator